MTLKRLFAKIENFSSSPVSVISILKLIVSSDREDYYSVIKTQYKRLLEYLAARYKI